MDFLKKLQNTIAKNNSLLCIGLDTDLTQIPEHLFENQDPVFEFNKEIIDVTHEIVCAYKPNIAFYEASGTDGLHSLKKTVEYVNNKYSEIPVICDAKRGDIDSTSEEYAKSLFSFYEFDAVTVNPYLGLDAIEPFLKHKENGVIILCRTSNNSASDFQDLLIDKEPLYIKVAKKVVQWNKTYGNCLLVAGATYPEELKKLREVTKDMFFLVPGIGTQGGILEKVLENGLTKEKSGLIMSISRGIIYLSRGENFAQRAKEKALELRDSINQHRK